MTDPVALLTRRAVLTWCTLAAGLGLLGGGLAGCGASGSTLVKAEVGRRPADQDAADGAVTAVADFSRDLLRALADDANLVCSPFSVLVVLAMVRNGATGVTAREMDQALHLPDLAALNAGLNAVGQTLASRSGSRRDAHDGKAKVELSVVQQVWGDQQDVWQPAFLDTLAADYGTGVRTSDIAGNPEAARQTVNDWVADATADRITEVLPSGSVNEMTRLILANALYVKAPWHEKLDPVGTQPFQTPQGPVSAEMLKVTLTAGGRRGSDWTTACLPLAGQDLALTVVLPDGTPADLLRRVTGAELVDLLRPTKSSVDVTMPAFTFRSRFSLPEVLHTLGMTRAFSDEAELAGLTATEPLRVARVEHQGWIAVDQDGLEAAAATAATVEATSALLPQVKLVLDRPFLFIVHDVALRLPLLVGIVADPAATGD
ncbi:serpin family protein [uncultured Friedmanniella sp.]|uniref:serpin family protein n=1 Tax=uncultured Friedmanniella sp. TaxID=335381 RepID=UPI0035C94BF0